MKILNIINNICKYRQRQRGAVLMVMLVILIMGASAMLLNALNSAAPRLAREKVTADALAQAKEALIGRAVADANRPGSLPCPDTNDDGNAESGSNCPSYIGRLPWKTLGINDLRDGSGEKLWYALSPNFADNTSNKINSNSIGTLLVYDNSGASLLTSPGSEAVAIIFAPDYPIASQQRDTSANKNSAQNYLDIGPNSINNATEAGPFIAANKINTFNDRLLIIRTRDFIPIVEKRVTKELAKAFTNYYSNNSNKYPYPANFNSCNSTNCNSDTTQCIGKVPVSTLSAVLTSMTWFKSNNWFDVVYYTDGTNIGTACTSSLTVSGANANALIIMPGIPLNGITRSTNLSAINITDYFEDAHNQNLDITYVSPSGNSNDLLLVLSQ